MIRRQLYRQARAVSESISRPVHHAQRTNFSLAALPSAQLRAVKPVSSSCSQQIPQRRWQSSEAEKKDESKPAEGEEKSAEAVKEDSAKEELEKKNKEIVDLKVCMARTHRRVTCYQDDLLS